MTPSAETPPSEQAPASRPARRPRVVRRAEVLTSVRLSPTFQRVTFTGAGLDGFEVTSPGGHIKVFLPAEGQRQPVLPDFGGDGPDYPEGAVRPVVRTYTPRRFDAGELRLEIDFALHGPGPASTWAARAEAGDIVGIAGPGQGYDIDPAADWFLLAGDETALPALAAIVAALPATVPADVHVELPDAEDRQELGEGANVRVHWHHRGDGPAGAAIESAVRQAELAAGKGRVWVAGEAAVVRRIRRHLLDERHLLPEHIVTRGYWRLGESNHPDHDYGE